MPHPRELSREIGFLGVKTIFFSLLTIISFEENTLIYYVPKFQDVCFTRSVVTAQSLGRKIGDSPCKPTDGDGEPYILREFQPIFPTFLSGV